MSQVNQMSTVRLFNKGGEALQIGQNQATVQDRAPKLDVRHKFIINEISISLNIDRALVEEELKATVGLNRVDEFFQNKTEPSIEFSLPIGETDDSSSGRGSRNSEHRLLSLVFTKKYPNSIITASNYGSELLFTKYNHLGKSINITDLSYEPLEQCDNSAPNSMGKIKAQSFGKLREICDIAENQCSDQSAFDIPPEFLEEILKFRSKLQDESVYNKLEEYLTLWIKKLEQIMTESEQIRREADDVGPSAEISYWKSRLLKFNVIFEKLESGHCKLAVKYLRDNEAARIRQWDSLVSQITNVLTEAKDNVKYLETFEQYLDTFNFEDPKLVKDHISSLMNSLKWMYEVSRFYNTPERITGMLVKITNQLINVCKEYLLEGTNERSIWHVPFERLSQKIGECCELSDNYRECFKRIKSEIEASQNKAIELSENYLFGKMLSFCSRLRLIEESFIIIMKFEKLGTIKIDGIDLIFAKFRNQAKILRAKSSDPLDYTKKEFDAYYREFKRALASICDQVDNFIDSWFHMDLNTYTLIDIIIKLEPLAEIGFEFKSKYFNILHIYDRFLQSTGKMFHQNRFEPKISPNMPPMSGRIEWARQICNLVSEPIKFFKDRFDILKEDPETHRVLSDFNRFVCNLLDYELFFYQIWCENSLEIADLLQENVLRVDSTTNMVVVNFNDRIIEFIEESRQMRSLGLEVPKNFSFIIQKENFLRQTKLSISQALKRSKIIQESVPSAFKQLTQPIRGKLMQKLIPGLKFLDWTSLNLNECNISALWRRIQSYITDIL